MPPDCWQTDNSNGLVMVIRNYNWLNLASRVLILLHWRLQHFLSLGCYHISFFFFIPFIPYSSHFQLLTSQCASLAPLVQAVNTHCLILTYNPRLAKVKVDPHAKNQGQRVQTGERPQTNGWTHTHTDATKRIISPAIRLIKIQQINCNPMHWNIKKYFHN